MIIILKNVYPALLHFHWLKRKSNQQAEAIFFALFVPSFIQLLVSGSIFGCNSHLVGVLKCCASLLAELHWGATATSRGAQVGAQRGRERKRERERIATKYASKWNYKQIPRPNLSLPWSLSSAVYLLLSSADAWLCCGACLSGGWCAHYVYVLRIRNVFGLGSKPKIASRFKLLLIKTCSWTVICFCARAHANPAQLHLCVGVGQEGREVREGSFSFAHHKTKSRQSDVSEDDGVKWAAALKHKMSESESEIKTQQATPTDTSFI